MTEELPKYPTKEFYNQDQFSEILPFVKSRPDCLILGGPADGNEAQVAASVWPEMTIIGIEPNIDFRDFQSAHGWAPNWPLLSAALSDETDVLDLWIPKINTRSGTLRPERNPDQEKETYKVPTIKIDGLDNFGPFENVILWLDIEGFEHRALQGAREMLRRRIIKIVNLEFAYSMPKNNELADRILTDAGFRIVHRWNHQPELVEDQVYVLE